jgi:hypothetical protein
MACSSCNQQTQTTKEFVSSKLGKCKQCILASFLGTLLGWALFVFVYFFQYNIPLLVFVCALAITFTFLLIAHFVAYLKNKVK